MANNDQSETLSKSKTKKELVKSLWDDNLCSLVSISSQRNADKDKFDAINSLLDVSERLYVKAAKDTADAIDNMVKGGQQNISHKKIAKKKENEDKSEDVQIKDEGKGILPEPSRRSVLDMLTSPYRRRHPLEKWSPYEIAVFEAAICYHGKNFYNIQKHLDDKTTGDVIDFYYYVWKHSNRYNAWKDKRDIIDSHVFNEIGG